MTRFVPPRRDVLVMRRATAALLGLLVVVVLLSLSVGRYPVPLATVLRILGALATGTGVASKNWTATEYVVVATVRLPRVLVALTAGFGLGLSGAALQGLFRNPLVGPQIVGISNGAAWGGVLGILLALPPAGIVGSAFLFGVVALAIVFALERVSRGGTLSIVLAGVIVSAFFSALVGLAEYFADPERQLPGIVYWLLGSFAAATSQSAWTILVPTVVASALLILLRWRINLLSLGDEDAAGLGLPVHRLRWTIVGLVTAIVSAQVAVSGAIGWVGLVVPHVARRLVGPDHRRTLPTSALLGAIYLVAVDDVARTLTSQEIPIGVLTALIGTPVFAVVFARAQSLGWTRD
jgi:iron complex transport system permease protein